MKRMANKSEIKKWLEEIHLTEKDIDRMWNEASEFNKFAKSSNENKWSWKTLELHAIKHIPNLKYNYLQKEKNGGNSR